LFSSKATLRVSRPEARPTLMANRPMTSSLSSSRAISTADQPTAMSLSSSRDALTADTL